MAPAAAGWLAPPRHHHWAWVTPHMRPTHFLPRTRVCAGTHNNARANAGNDGCKPCAPQRKIMPLHQTSPEAHFAHRAGSCQRTCLRPKRSTILENQIQSTKPTRGATKPDEALRPSTKRPCSSCSSLSGKRDITASLVETHGRCWSQYGLSLRFVSSDRA